MYAEDAAWEEAFSKVDPLITKFEGYVGKLNNAQTIFEFQKDLTETMRVLDNLIVYTSLRRSEDTRASEAQSMYVRAVSKYTEFGAAVSFADPEMLSLPQEQLEAIAKDPILKDYEFTMQELVRQRPHTLTVDEEKIIANFGEVLGAPGDIADNLQDADMIFEPAKDSEGKEHELSSANWSLLQIDADRTLRKSAFENYYKGYEQHINTFASTYSANVKRAAVEAKLRGYQSSRQASLYRDNIDLSVYDKLIDTVRAHMPDMYRYVALRKKLLGVDELHFYDVYAPLVKDDTTKYTYDQAKEMVLQAVAPLGEEYCSIIRQGFDTRWVDVYPNKGKSSGAYSSGTYDSNPYVMCNFTGTLDSVSTLAHEMGHSLHSWFSRHTQPPQYAEYTLFVAEVASTVNENLLIEHLLKDEKDPAKRMMLLNQYLENFKGTVFRQTMFAEFEREAHAMSERGEALTPKALNELYAGLVKDYFGPDMVQDEQIKYEWSRIPHFYRPFYVYKYATGYTTAVALSEGIRTKGGEAVSKYLDFLHMGGSKYPLDELKHAGVDLTTPEPIDRALNKFRSVIEDAEATADLLLK
jgi:oligoendopeptidase F